MYAKNGTLVPEPTQTAITRWRADPFARGSYSYYPTGAAKNITTGPLAEPLGRLLFAGEATSDKPATGRSGWGGRAVCKMPPLGVGDPHMR